MQVVDYLVRKKMFLYDSIGLGVVYQPIDVNDAGQAQAALDIDLIEAARSGDADLVTRLLEQGADVSATDDSW